MVDINFEADKLLAELGFSDLSSDRSSVASSSAGSAVSGGAPPPPPPPPPPTVKASPPASTGGSVIPKPPPPPGQAKKDFGRQAQDEINEVFDSVISFASKASNRKKVPPPVAPKPKRKVHVSSYTMNISKKKPGSPPAADVTVTAAAAPPKPAVEPPKPAPEPPKPAPEPPKPTAAPVPQVVSEVVGAPAVPVAYGPGLESFEVNTPGTFEVSCPPETLEEDLFIKAVGPTGSKSVEIESLGEGQFVCSFVPTVAGDHKVTIKLKGKEIEGSPFNVNVQFAQYTDKAIASGPGLESGTTNHPAKFVVQLKEDAGFTRLRVHILGPSKAEPVEMVEVPNENAISVTYNPTAPGDYTLRVLWGESHVPGSPFTVPISGEVVNDPSKVKVTGSGLNGGDVNETLKFFVEGEEGAGPGPLGVRMIGPSKPTLIADDSSDEGVEVSFTCRDPGEYQLVLKWGDEELPASPYLIKIVGEGREVRPELCVASGEGISKGAVSETAEFLVTVPDEAGPGTLGVSIVGPHPPKPIKIINNLDGTMTVTYLPIAPGEYTIEVTWGKDHIKDSPFKAMVTGDAISNAALVTATGPFDQPIKCNQLSTIEIVPGEKAGAGPLRAKMEGPAKLDLQLSASQQGTFMASFVPKEPGSYKLMFMWGPGDDPPQISGSPFTVNVEKN